MVALASARLDAFATYVLGPQGSTRGKYLDKYFVPQVCMAASSLGLTREPELILPVWIAELTSPPVGPAVAVKRPSDGLVAFWDGHTSTFIAVERNRSTDVMALDAGGYDADVITLQNGKGFLGTSVPGLAVAGGGLHLALGLRNSIGVTYRVAESGRYFERLRDRLSPPTPPGVTP